MADWWNVNTINEVDVRRSIGKNQRMTGRAARMHWHTIDEPCTDRCETVEPDDAP